MAQPSLVTRPWERETFSAVSPPSLTRGVCRAGRRGGGRAVSYLGRMLFLTKPLVLVTGFKSPTLSCFQFHCDLHHTLLHKNYSPDQKFFIPTSVQKRSFCNLQS